MKTGFFQESMWAPQPPTPTPADPCPTYSPAEHSIATWESREHYATSPPPKRVLCNRTRALRGKMAYFLHSIPTVLCENRTGQS